MSSYRPIVPDGHHLGDSHTVDGAVTGHIFEDGTNRLVGHASWEEVEDSGDSYQVHYHDDEHEPEPRPLTEEEIEALAQLIGLAIGLVILGVTAAAPHVSKFWRGNVVPRARAVGRWLRRSRRKGRLTVDQSLVPSKQIPAARMVFVASRTGIELSPAASKVSMSRAEWEERLRAVVAAEAFSDEQRRILAQAQIVEDGRAIEAGSEGKPMTAGEFAERLTAGIASEPAALDESARGELLHLTAPVDESKDEPPAAALAR